MSAPDVKDDIKFALQQVMAFYDKTLEQNQWPFWYSVLGKLPSQHVLRALKEYVGVGKFAPRPAHIVELVGSYAGPSNYHRDREELPEGKPCPPEIAEAWRWYIGRTSLETGTPLFQSTKDYTSEQQEKMLHIVNHEARASANPDAILDEHKLAEVWGA